MAKLIEQKLHELGEAIQLRQAHAIGAVQKLLQSDCGKQIMDEIRSVKHAMEQEELGFLQLGWDQQQL